MNNDDLGKCTKKCMPAKCGDGLVWDGHEACDDGVLSPNGDCLPGCKAAKCGDGLVRTDSLDPANNEECDPGTATGGNFCSPTCKKECTFGASAGGSDLLFAGHCYSVFPTAVTWEDASNACLIVGGHLVTIESAAENNALKAKVTADSWIGLTSKYSVGQFIWYQGPGKVLTLNYKNPGPGALSSLPDQCEVYSSSTQQWNDANCTATHGYICEFDY
jgi:cysteine-rich repeat protein